MIGRAWHIGPAIRGVFAAVAAERSGTGIISGFEMRRRKAFTLVELLVVIAIIAVLIAILLPVLRKARDVALRTSCAAQMHQFAAAWLMYADDNKGILVPCDTEPGAWVEDRDTLNSIQRGLLYKYLKTAKVYRCPADDVNTRLRTYSINNYLGTKYPGAWSDWYEIRKLSSIHKAAETIVFCEENDPRGYNEGGWVQWYPLDVSPGQWIDFIATWHELGANFAFADGHCEHWVWSDNRTLHIRDFYTTTANNADLVRIRRALVTWPRKSP